MADLGVYVVNLASRPDRWEHAVAQCRREGLEPVRVPGVQGSQLSLEQVAEWQQTVDGNIGPGRMKPGQAAAKLGLQFAHIDAVDTALAGGHRLALLFEDDVVLAEGFLPLLASRLPHVPTGWRLVTLGSVHHKKPSKVGRGVYRVRRCSYAHALLANREGLVALRRLLSRMDAPIDVGWRELADAGVFYALHPPLAVQREDFSDISGRRTDPFSEGRDMGV